MVDIYIKIGCMEDKKTFIYGLYSENDPDKKIRYIGKADDLEYRLKRHKNNTKHRHKTGCRLTHKEYWIISCDYNINYTVLDVCYGDEWKLIEKQLIESYDNLTNTASGGLGGSGVKYDISYDECKKWVRENTNITSKSMWVNNLHKLADHIPKYPRQKYLNDGWISWGDFLSTGRVCDNYVDYLSYDEAKKVIHGLNLKKVVHYIAMAKRGDIPNNIPNRPERYYLSRGWVGWSDFLGCEIIANQHRVFYPLDVFKENLKKLGIKTTAQYQKYLLSVDRDYKMPYNPSKFYSKTGEGVTWSDLVN